MAKKKPLCKAVIIDHNEPEFKPGDKPYTSFGKEILNKDVPWDSVLADISEVGYSLSAIADIAETTFDVLTEVLKKNFDVLSFRSGARIISLHYRLCPTHYVEE